MNELDRSAIKRDARAFIGQDNRWWFMFVAYLPIWVITFVFSFGFSFTWYITSDGNWSIQTSNIGGNILDILLIPMEVAFCGLILNYLRGFSPDWKSLYKEGFDRYGEYLLVGFVTSLIIGLWTLLLIIPGIIAALSYSQVYYVLHDNPRVGSARPSNQSCAHRRLQRQIICAGAELYRLVAVGWFNCRHCVYLCLAVLSDHQGDVLRKFKTDYVSGRHDSAGGRRAYAFRPLRRAKSIRWAKSV